MSKPLIFISHKHSDSEIATVVAKFIRDRSLGSVDVFLSSNWTFDGPRLGVGLNNELNKILWRTDALILIYTAADQDWQYCMYECGTATRQDSPETRIIVFQCGRDVPAPFHADLRVDVRKADDIRRFTRQFLTSPSFFPARNQPLAPDVAQETQEQAAEELFVKLQEVIPKLSDALDEWPVWPYMRIELPSPEVEKLAAASAAERVKLSLAVVEEHGVVIRSDPRAAQLFGMASMPDRMRLKDLLRIWRDRFPTADASWFDSCCEQIMVGARREFPIIRWTPLREADGESSFTPVLSRVKRVPFGGCVQFDIYFYNLSDPRAVPVTSRMIPTSEFFYKNLGQNAPESIRLKDLVGELRQRGLNRIPILSGGGQPLYIVHRSMIDKFVAENVWGRSGSSPESFTLADLFAEPDMKEIFEKTFVVVNEKAALAEAKSAMLARPGCSDVFVTKNGRHDEPVLGWLTNVDMARSG